MNSTVGQPERATQKRVLALLCDELGWQYLGDWSERAGNAAIEEGLLTAWLAKRGVSAQQAAVVLHRLRTEAANPTRTLYGNNQAVYSLLRYGVPVKLAASENTETVWLVDWDDPKANQWAVAEEVTLQGPQPGSFERRPDVVLYLNGLAIGVLELKNSRVSIGEGIRQLLSNQLPEFHAGFFSTVQLVLAGNDSEGLRYGTTGTPEKLFLAWKEDEHDNTRFKLDKYLLKLCAKPRLLELLRDFVLFDGGIKKLPRVHQYFGIKAAQAFVARRESGVIWHTQGSGKSLVMVLLARWILEQHPHARIAIVTDRDELDGQIERVFNEAGTPMARAGSGRELMRLLAQPAPRLLCSLVHKFGVQGRGRDDAAFENFLAELQGQPAAAAGELFVFVDECHRTQSGRLHRVMKALLPQAVFIGFTGTPLLKQDKATSLEVFGRYIHTYKFGEAVEDAVVLDLVYEARDIDQHLGSKAKVDAWFEAKTKALNDWQKDELKKQWGTMQQVLSSRQRMERVVQDIVFDFGTKRRLMSERGNAMLVAGSIYEACKYFVLFNRGDTGFKGRCAIVTSYNPQAQHVTLEETGAHNETDKQFIFNTYTELLKDVVPRPGLTRTESYEAAAKERFIKEPAQMKLLVVVDKLLTGFDAPPCTYLYIDKVMQDHGLFQAICRTNRLDGEDKDFGYIVDYKRLLTKVERAIAVYTSELDTSAGGASPEVLMKDRLATGREKLDEALEALHLICEPVLPPRGELEHIHHFCGNTEVAGDLREREPQRAALYKAVAALLRAYANIADELEGAGYGAADQARLQERLKHYLNVRDIVRQASGETLDLKAYEADMRHLIDAYIQADEPRRISPFEGIGLLDLIVKTGIAEAIAARLGSMKNNRQAIAETIENNVRRKIAREQLTDPAYFETMSALLEEIIQARRDKAIEYEEYLRRMADLAKRVTLGQAEDTPPQLDTPGRRALYNNLKAQPPKGFNFAEPAADGTEPAVALALRLHAAVTAARPNAWRGVRAKELVVQRALYDVLQDVDEVERFFRIVQQHPEF
ncbi:MAG: HsdR family type I site-specific deoxyribonuclease [Rubrivivax sp.]|nr:HsdR family type I site-specific deoxyribonuclease [Rubrivivax sp.]